MNLPASNPSARVASLHLHPLKAGEPFQDVPSIQLERDNGIAGNPRYYARRNREGQPTTRQVSLIEREQLAEHAGALGLATIAPGAVRANIETVGINLVPLVGRKIQIGDAVLLLAAPRDPCDKMDLVCQGLRELMAPQKQGVMAQVIQSGAVHTGDAVKIVSD